MIQVEAFEALASSTNGIAKLRQLILELAVRGLLVPQDPNDEPASVLLEKIASEKQQLMKAGKIKKQLSLPAISEKDKPFDLPAGWKWVYLSEILALITDGDHQPPPKAEIGIPFLVIGNLNKARVNLNGCRYVPEEYYQSLDWGRQPLKGDILYTVTGSYGIPILVDTDELFCVQRHVAIFKTAHSSPRKYLISLLGSKFAFEYATQIATGIAQKTVPLTGLRKMPIPLPPEQEQLRINAKIDELMALCDQLDQRQNHSNIVHQQLLQTLLESLTQAADNEAFQKTWSQIAAHFDTLFTTEASIDQLKRVILQLAVMGKLVPQDSNDEPASVLLEKINAEKQQLTKDGKVKKQQSLPEISNEERPFQLPNTWAWARLAEISQINPRNEINDEQEVSFVPMSLISTSHTGVHQHEKRLWSEVKKGFTHFAEGDVGVAKITPCFENSKAAVFCNLHNGAGAGTTELHIVRPYNGTLLPRYILTYFKSPQFLLVGETKMTGTAGQKRVPKDFVANNPFPLPPLAEQYRIIAKVDELMAICDQLKSQISKSQQIQEHLATAIVKKAAA